MRFDPKRALEEAGAFPENRLPWTDRGRMGIRLAAEAFARAGLQVECLEVNGFPSARNLQLAIGWLGFGFWLTLALLFKLHGGFGLPIRAVMLLLAPAWLLMSGSVVHWLAPRFGRAIRTKNVIAQRTSAPIAKLRVVFVTSLDASPPLPQTSARKWSGWLFTLLVLIQFFISLSRVTLPTAIKFALPATFQIVLVAWVVGRIRPFVGEGKTDNADGLGALTELARTWPKSFDERLETRFAALGGQALNLAGLRALGRQIREDWPRKPTLVVGLWSPGVGQRITLASPSLEELAGEAAASLWIPTRRPRSVTIMNDLCPFGNDPPFIGLVGVAEPGEGPAFSLESLTRTAQLATELALRWSRRETASSQEEGQTPARSSQNRG